MERATTLSEENQEGTGEGKEKKNPVRFFFNGPVPPTSSFNWVLLSKCQHAN